MNKSTLICALLLSVSLFSYAASPEEIKAIEAARMEDPSNEKEAEAMTARHDREMDGKVMDKETRAKYAAERAKKAEAQAEQQAQLLKELGITPEEYKAKMAEFKKIEAENTEEFWKSGKAEEVLNKLFGDAKLVEQLTVSGLLPSGPGKYVSDTKGGMTREERAKWELEHPGMKDHTKPIFAGAKCVGSIETSAPGAPAPPLPLILAFGVAAIAKFRKSKRKAA